MIKQAGRDYEVMWRAGAGCFWLSFSLAEGCEEVTLYLPVVVHFSAEPVVSDTKESCGIYAEIWGQIQPHHQDKGQASVKCGPVMM